MRCGYLHSDDAAHVADRKTGSTHEGVHEPFAGDDPTGAEQGCIYVALSAVESTGALSIAWFTADHSWLHRSKLIELRTRRGEDGRTRRSEEGCAPGCFHNRALSHHRNFLAKPWISGIVMSISGGIRWTVSAVERW